MKTVSLRTRHPLEPGDVVRLPRRFINAVLPWGSDDRVVVLRVLPGALYVRPLANPTRAWYVRRRGVGAALRGR